LQENKQTSKKARTVSKKVTSGRFVKMEHWERWRDKQKLVPGCKNRGVSAAPPPGGITSWKKFENVYMKKSCNLVHFGPGNSSQCRP